MVLGTSPIHYSIVSNGRGDMPFYFELKKILNKKNFVMFVMPIKYILYLRFIQYLIVRIYYLVFIQGAYTDLTPLRKPELFLGYSEF